jgi:hypothetical protein
MIVRNGPTRPRLPISLIHPLGPLFKHLPLSLRRHLLSLRVLGRWGNFRAPRLWSEKMAWRVLNDDRLLLQMASDKLASKEYIRRVISSLDADDSCALPVTYWVGTDIRELRRLAGRLPARWVLKPNHTCGRVVLIDSDQEPIDWQALQDVTKKWLLPDEEVTVMGHRAYRGARRLFFAEERLGSGEDSPNDVRVFGFTKQHESPLIWEVQESTGSHTPVFTNYRYTETFERKPRYHFRDGPLTHHTELDDAGTEVRAALLAIGRRAIQPFDHLRVDFYLDKRQLWFGELAVYPGAGLVGYGVDIDRERGSHWTLPDLTQPDPREAEWRALLAGTPKGTLQR